MYPHMSDQLTRFAEYFLTRSTLMLLLTRTAFGTRRVYKRQMFLIGLGVRHVLVTDLKPDNKTVFNISGPKLPSSYLSLSNELMNLSTLWNTKIELEWNRLEMRIQYSHDTTNHVLFLPRHHD